MLVSKYHVNATKQRVDHWLSNATTANNTSLFWSTNGFANRVGSFVAQQNGFYVVSLVLFVIKNDSRFVGL